MSNSDDRARSPKLRILFLLSGSISAYKACQALSQLVRDGHEVRTAATPGALAFIGPSTLEGLSGFPPLVDLHAEGRAMDHVHLTRWADRAALCPASANAIAKLAHGMCDDAVTALALAWPREKPFFLFPAMNATMLAADATQGNLRLLSQRGLRVAPAPSGRLACGENGEGRLLEPAEIVRRLTDANRAHARPGRVLVTGGATRESIDGIRFVSNVSTGRTAAAIADDLAGRGWQVTYLHGIGAAPSLRAEQAEFSDYQDLDRKLRSRLGETTYAGVIHAAAVADFGVSAANARPTQKLESGSPLVLTLEPHVKLLPRLKTYSRHPGTRVIGFKLTLNEPAQSEDRARRLLGPEVDAVVANDWSQVQADRSRHPGTLVQASRTVPFQSVAELCEHLDALLTADRPTMEEPRDLMS